MESLADAEKLVDVEIKDELTLHRDEWASFGDMVPDNFRVKLNKIFARLNMTADEIFTVHYLAANSDNRDEILGWLGGPNFSVKNNPWFNKVKKFFVDEITMSFTVAQRQGKLPLSSISVTRPNLDILCFLMGSHLKHWKIQCLLRRPSFSQIALSSTLQTEAEAGYRRFYWDKTDAATFSHDNYKKMVAEKHRLLFPDKRVEFFPGKYGYANNDILEYLVILGKFLKRDYVLPATMPGPIKSQVVRNADEKLKEMGYYPKTEVEMDESQDNNLESWF
ncbi:hypothetical protein K470DRAFT_266904 [Piedraia hortae CBS 480.64]|uniref:Uncharacterized protein n=1 Tax=Piedraia hortae CBS 480.64 TaxID=1314780 RepID=A0A6A7BPR4_9PEZI|nr:hypothetical protein K470DRAFT_266904 [Piedraia hortae CBS 480.64]